VPGAVVQRMRPTVTVRAAYIVVVSVSADSVAGNFDAQITTFVAVGRFTRPHGSASLLTWRQRSTGSRPSLGRRLF
jgi:hypothetical protein